MKTTYYRMLLSVKGCYFKRLRLQSEAKLLLHHTDWSVGDIAESLGFEYPTCFTSFFRKHTGTAPLAYRQAG